MSENILKQEVPVTDKPKKSRKKLWIILAGIAVVLVIVAVVFFSYYGQYSGPMYQGTQEVYDYFNEAPISSVSLGMNRYERKLNSIADMYDEFQSQADSAITQAEDLPEECIPFVREANQMLIDFFAEEYGVSVEAELAELRVQQFDLPEGTTGVYYTIEDGITDGKVVFISDDIIADLKGASSDEYELKFWKESFYGTYLHEAIHYLGVSCPTIDPDTGKSVLDGLGMVEGMTQALTLAVMEHGGYPVDFNNIYMLNTQLAQQFLIADSELVVELVDGFDYMSVEEINAYLDERSFDGMGEAMDKVLSVTIEYGMNKRFQRDAQYLMGEYLKHYNLTEEQMIEIADLFIAPISKIS